MRWRIYYGDGSTYSDGNGPAWEAPARNVQMIAVADPDHNWQLCRSNDYYWYLPDIVFPLSLSETSSTDSWQGGDIFGLWDYLVEPGPKKVLFGRTITSKEFETILMRAYSDMPQKTGWRPGERENAGVEEHHP